MNPTPNVAFTYDPYFPRVTSMTDGTGVTAYAYGPVGALGALRLVQEAPPLTGVAIAYAYDALGRRTSRTVAGAGPETVAYDAIARVTSHASDLGDFTLAYLGQTAQPTSRVLTGASLGTSWSYLPNSGDRRLAGVATTGLSAGQSTAFAFSSNAGNQITGATQTSDAIIPYPPASLSQSAAYNNLNQLTTLQGQSLTYDADGNLTADGTRTFAWDAENRLIAIGYPGQPGKATTFAYDGLGRRVQIGATPAGGGSATVISYVWCGAALCQARNASGAITREYLAEGEYAPGATAAALYYAPDQLGSVRRVFSSAAAPTYDYDPYGVPLQTTAPATDFNYAGMFYETGSGLYLTNHRPYDPASGRFLSRDPAGEGGDTLGNLYAYVGGDPIDLNDPLGLFCFSSLFKGLPNGIPPWAFAIAIVPVIAGGGPEDPIGDAAALAILEAAGEGAGAPSAMQWEISRRMAW